MRAAIYALFAFLGSAAIIWMLAIVVYALGSDLDWWQDRDGGLAMGFAFTIGPFFAITGGTIAGVLVFIRNRKGPR